MFVSNTIVLSVSKDFSCFVTFNTVRELTGVGTSVHITAHSVGSTILGIQNWSDIVGLVALSLRSVCLCKGWVLTEDRLIHAIHRYTWISVASCSQNHRLVHESWASLDVSYCVEILNVIIPCSCVVLGQVSCILMLDFDFLSYLISRKLSWLGLIEPWSEFARTKQLLVWCIRLVCRHNTSFLVWWEHRFGDTFKCHTILSSCKYVSSSTIHNVIDPVLFTRVVQLIVVYSSKWIVIGSKLGQWELLRIIWRGLNKALIGTAYAQIIQGLDVFVWWVSTSDSL
jgi:hypothetical protein